METKAVYDYEPTKESYEFCYWRGSDNKYYDPSDVYEGEEDVTLKAVWRRIYTITYLDREGNVFATQLKRPVETIRLYEEVPPIYNGNTFAYWMIKETGEYVAAGRKYKKDFDATLIPCYNTSYDITYYDSDKETVINSYSMPSREHSIPSTVPEKSGYTFLCWNVDGTNTYYLPGETFFLGDDIDFVAVWTLSNDTCVVYDLTEGEGDFPVQYADYNTLYNMYSDVPTREGYVFDCWEVVRTVPEDSSLIGLKLAPETVLTNEYSFVVRPLWLKPWVRIKNIPSGNTINLLETNSIQLEAEFFPTENDFSVIPTAMSARSAGMVREYDVHFGYESSNEDVAIIDETTGMLILKGVGTTTVTLLATYNIFNLERCVVYKVNLSVMAFEFDDEVVINDMEFKQKVLNKMTEYYYNNSEIKNVMDGNNPDCNTCIFAFEGLGDPSLKEEDTINANDSKTSEEHPFWRFMAMMVVTEGKKIKYITRRASTFPDRATSYSYATATRKKGPTALKEGIYGYKTGVHLSKYVALIPSDDDRIAWYKNDGCFVCDESSGTNLHASTAAISNSYENSTGCQVVHFNDYISFGKAVGFLEDKEDLEDLESTGSSLGDSLYAKIGTSFKEKENIQVKYILDRTFDETNDFYSKSYSFEIFKIELKNLKQINNPTEEEQNRIIELERYLSYYETIDNSYKKGIFYPITKSCETSKCPTHKKETEEKN